ncbi:VOC family protein [Novosphingobium sp. MW5]|nr:VOC family protein [Novosphingobium sp. MW5]
MIRFATITALVIATATPQKAAAQSAPAIAPEGMVGPAIYVTQPERSLKFYTEGLGMKLRMRFGPKDRPDMVVGFGSNPADAGIMLVTDKTGPILQGAARPRL